MQINPTGSDGDKSNSRRKTGLLPGLPVLSGNRLAKRLDGPKKDGGFAA